MRFHDAAELSFDKSFDDDFSPAGAAAAIIAVALILQVLPRERFRAA